MKCPPRKISVLQFDTSLQNSSEEVSDDEFLPPEAKKLKQERKKAKKEASNSTKVRVFLSNF